MAQAKVKRAAGRRGPSSSAAAARRDIAALAAMAVAFRDEREWKQFHNPKDMALSLCLEAAEVLELTQWKNGRELVEHLRARREDLADELSDVLYWVLTIANDFEIDIAGSFARKIEKSARKYPVAKARGQAKKYTEL